MKRICLLQGALGVTLLLSVSVGRIALGIPFHRLLFSRTLLLYAGLFTITTLMSALFSFVLRRHRSGFFHLATLALLLIFLYDGASFTKVTLSLGEGEAVPTIDFMEKGPWGTLPELRIACKAIEPNGRLTLITGRGREIVSPGSALHWKGFTLRVTGLHTGLIISTRPDGGPLLEQVLFKLPPDPGKRVYYEPTTLPYRVYITTNGKAPGNAAPPLLPATVYRNLVKVKRGTMKRGEPFSFEGWALAYETGKRWVGIDLRRTISLYPFLIPALLLLAALAAGRRRHLAP